MLVGPREGRVGGNPLIELKIRDSHFILFGRYRSHLQDFQEFIRLLSRMFRHASFLNSSFSIFVYFKNNIFQRGSRTSWIVLSNFVYPKSGIMVSGGHGHFHWLQESQKQSHFHFWGLKGENNQFPGNLNIPTELFAFPKFRIQATNGLMDRTFRIFSHIWVQGPNLLSGCD